jgi:replicative DNA helicase
MSDSGAEENHSDKPDFKRSKRRKQAAAPVGDRLPPHSPEAEQGVLGCVLLAPNDCMGECIEKLKTAEDVFYDLRHQTIFQLLSQMYDAREAIDIITVQQKLKDQQLLEQVGGIPYLSALQDSVPSAANLSYYLEIVKEKYLLRKMIHVCTDVVNRVYEHEGEVDSLMDEVERDVLRISESRVQGQSATMKDLVKKAINTIEDFHQRQGMLTGVPTGFADMDKMTSGLHGGEMIVIAARPSMGKCLTADAEILLSDGRLATIEELCRRREGELFTLGEGERFERARPSAFVDDGVKPAFRVTTRLGRQVEATLPHPFLTERGWVKLMDLKPGERIAVPRKLAAFGRLRARRSEVKLLAYLIGDGQLTGATPTFTHGNPVVCEDFTRSVEEFGGLAAQYADFDGLRTPSLRVVAETRHEPSQGYGQRMQSVLEQAGTTFQQVALALGARPVGAARAQTAQQARRTRASIPSCETQAVPAPERNVLREWLAGLGLWERTAETRFIPELVFTLCREQVALFLNRLFATDGWVAVLNGHTPQIGFSTASERVARQVQHLLTRFGVVAALRKNDRKGGAPSWRLEIAEKASIRCFVEEIGSLGRESSLQEVFRLTGQTGRTSRTSPPPQPESEIYWDTITAIEPTGMRQVYDLTIDRTHNFVANDICVHNTSLAMNIAEHVSIDQNLPVGVFSLEMTSESLVLRMLCSRSRVNMRNVRDGFLAERDFPKLTGAAGKLAKAPLYIDDASGLSILQLRAKARRMYQQHGIKLFVIDYLQLLHSTAKRAENRQQEIADISSGIKSLAKELNVPVIVLSQLNREMEKDKNRKPRMSDLRESGSIEQDADLIGLLYKPSAGDDEDAAAAPPPPGEEEAVAVNLLIAKQRNGPTGDVCLTFMKSYTRFENAAKISDEDAQH